MSKKKMVAVLTTTYKAVVEIDDSIELSQIEESLAGDELTAMLESDNLHCDTGLQFFTAAELDMADQRTNARIDITSGGGQLVFTKV